jgi:hypothetical protein
MIPGILFSQYVTGLSKSLSNSRRQRRTKMYATVNTEGYDKEHEVLQDAYAEYRVTARTVLN